MEALGSQTNLFSEYMENQNRKKSKMKNVLKADETWIQISSKMLSKTKFLSLNKNK